MVPGLCVLTHDLVAGVLQGDLEAGPQHRSAPLSGHTRGNTSPQPQRSGSAPRAHAALENRTCALPEPPPGLRVAPHVVQNSPL